jgi:hypothetical protein
MFHAKNHYALSNASLSNLVCRPQSLPPRFWQLCVSKNLAVKMAVQKILQINIASVVLVNFTPKHLLVNGLVEPREK